MLLIESGDTDDHEQECEERRRVQREGVEALEESGALDDLDATVDAGDVRLEGKDGLIQQLIKAGPERGLQAELSEHVGYEKGDPEAGLHPNSRNGAFSKTVASSVGDVDLAIPRDRHGSFTPVLVPKGSRRVGGLDDMIVSLYAGGLTVRDIEHHLVSTIGTEISRETISTITDEDEVLAWQQRPLEAFYPVLYLEALIVKVRDGAHVRSKATHIAVGVIWTASSTSSGSGCKPPRGAKFWAGVCAQLANRGIQDVLIVCCEGLNGFPEATWPTSPVQTCVVHLVRAAMRFVSYKSREAVAAALKPIYQAADVAAAVAALREFAASELGVANPNTVRVFEDAWERVTQFLAFPPMLRRIIYPPTRSSR